MKRIILLLFAFFIIYNVNAQSTTAFNPLIQNIHFSPEPNVYGFQNCSETLLKFNLGLTTQNNAVSFATDPLKVNICLQGFLPANLNTSLVVSGVQAGNFNWTYDILTNCIQGVQSDTMFGTGSNIFNLDPRALGEISVRLQIAPYLPVPATLSVDASLDIPNYMLVGNAPDDSLYVQTQNYIGLTSASGTLYLDNANNNTPTGTPNGRPSTALMYVNVIDDSSGLVEGSTLIDVNGSYFVDSLRPERTYNISISTTKGTKGQIPPIPAVPTAWSFANEDCCDNTGNDGLANGIIPAIWTNTCPIENANFSITNSSDANSIAINYINTPLAIDNLNFQLIKKDCNALLFWNGSKELQTKRYEIMQKKKTDLEYAKIGEVSAETNQGTDKQYTFLADQNDGKNTEYLYKLHLIDATEQILVSPIRTISSNCKEEQSYAHIYPNPAKDNIQFVLDNTNGKGIMNIHIIDVAGKVLYKTSKDIVEGHNNIKFDITNFSSGYYFLKYTDTENNIEGSLKFIIN